MSQYKTLIKFMRAVLIVMIASFIAITYNNCGQRGFYTERAFIPNQKLQDELMVSYQGKIDVSICRDSTQYVCVRKIFSQDVENSQSEMEFPCAKTSDNVELCVSGLQFSYNSSVAIANCREDCRENYEYEEFNCYVKLSNVNGVYPLQATASTYIQALNETHASCLRVVGGK